MLMMEVALNPYGSEVLDPLFAQQLAGYVRQRCAGLRGRRHVRLRRRILRAYLAAWLGCPGSFEARRGQAWLAARRAFAKNQRPQRADAIVRQVILQAESHFAPYVRWVLLSRATYRFQQHWTGGDAVKVAFAQSFQVELRAWRGHLDRENLVELIVRAAARTYSLDHALLEWPDIELAAKWLHTTLQAIWRGDYEGGLQL